MPYLNETAATSKSRSITSTVEELDAVIGRLQTYATALGNLADRVTGPRPREVGGIQGDPNAKQARPPIIDMVMQRYSVLCNIANDIEDSVQRLENTL